MSKSVAIGCFKAFMPNVQASTGTRSIWGGDWNGSSPMWLECLIPMARIMSDPVG